MAVETALSSALAKVYNLAYFGAFVIRSWTWP